MQLNFLSSFLLQLHFDSIFDYQAQYHPSVLGDTSRPILMFGAWAGLPGTLGYGIGQAIYDGIVGCYLTEYES